MVLAAIGTFVTASFTDRLWIKLVAAVAVPALGFGILIDGLPLVGFLRAVLAEPSVALIMISALLCARLIIGWQPNLGQLDVLRACVFATAVIIYPSALGVGITDLYALGYNPYTGLVLSLTVVLAYFLPIFSLVAFWVASALCAYGYGLGESDNIVDYLIDPVAMLCAFMSFMRCAWKKVRRAI